MVAALRPESHDYELLNDLIPVVLAWCKRLGGPHVVAEDAAADVMEIALRKMHTRREKDALQSWLFGVTRRVLAAHRRRGWVKRWIPGLSIERADPSPDPYDDAKRAQLARSVRAAIERLPLHHREVIVLCDLEERSDSEVAGLLGVPKNTIKSRLRRARSTLRVDLAQTARDQIDWPEEAP